ncbi:hypothetical protein CASFOL_000565 [Castilleja foliolosa]|uniref:Transcription repressor n=1 Tax=Castilleja foliolosa TaxID=1961234 RepID=A0ABD3EKP3_9LAMI
MGNYRFRLSDMIPNAWFYKLNKTHHYKTANPTIKKLQAQSSSSPPNPNSQITKLPLLSEQRKSYYFTRDITLHPDSPITSSTISVSNKHDAIRAGPPRKSPRRRRSTKRSRQKHGGLTPDDAAFEDVLASCKKCQTRNDVVICIADDRPIKINGHDLPPIITKKQAHHQPEKIEHGKTSPGVKLRTNTPKIANRRINQGRRSVGGGPRRSTSESFAVVKTSKDPGRDFRESMVEMIVENNIRASKDLEDLLACYLSLNSYEYHGLIINVFKQIWFDFIRLRPN